MTRLRMALLLFLPDYDLSPTMKMLSMSFLTWNSNIDILNVLKRENSCLFHTEKGMKGEATCFY